MATLRVLASVNGATIGFSGEFYGNLLWDLWDLERFNRLPEGMFYEKEIVWDLIN